MQKITPFLWFDNQAEEAANFYVSIFRAVSKSMQGQTFVSAPVVTCIPNPGQTHRSAPTVYEIANRSNNSKIRSISRYGEEGPGPKGSAMTVVFQLDGEEFIALNGGPPFNFTEAISFVVNCETQQEVDEFWEKLSEGGEESMCGWLKDKYGLSWQIVPTILGKMLTDPDPQKSKRVMEAMLKMKKIVIDDLKQAYEGK